jgi:DNA-binding GntR family transcriptional regulator
MQDESQLAPPSGKYRRGSSASEVCAGLRRQILTLELKPGRPLDEREISAAYGVSRSPVREAINRLSAERLVVTLPNRGAVVAPVDLTGFPHFMAALDLQQRYATRLAARHRTSADLDRLVARAEQYNMAVRELEPMGVLQGNYDFHLAVAEAGGNPYIARHYRELLSEARRYLHIHIEYLIATQGNALLADQHLDFVEAIRNRDVELADEVAHRHALQFEERFLKALRHMPDPNFRIEVEAAGAPG